MTEQHFQEHFAEGVKGLGLADTNQPTSLGIQEKTYHGDAGAAGWHCYDKAKKAIVEVFVRPKDGRKPAALLAQMSKNKKTFDCATQKMNHKRFSEFALEYVKRHLHDGAETNSLL
jgi:hypothetical protein